MQSWKVLEKLKNFVKLQKFFAWVLRGLVKIDVFLGDVVKLLGDWAKQRFPDIPKLNFKLALVIIAVLLGLFMIQTALFAILYPPIQYSEVGTPPAGSPTEESPSLGRNEEVCASYASTLRPMPEWCK